jgi:Uma2 family endonuclease
MGLPLRKSEEIFTYGQYVTWSDNKRWELINGIPYNMTPAPIRFHQKINGKIFSRIEHFLRDKSCEVYIAPFDVRLPEGNERDEDILTVVQPDISVICDRSKLDVKGCKGAPDFIIEILSPSTAKKDRITKLYLYERFGVKEYWLVSPDEKIVQVYILGENGQYGTHKFFTEEQILPCLTLPGLEINLSEIFVED